MNFEKKESHVEDEAKSTAGQEPSMAEHSFLSCPTTQSSLHTVGLEKMEQMTLDDDGEPKEGGESEEEKSTSEIIVYNNLKFLCEDESMTIEERTFFQLLRSSPLETRYAYGEVNGKLLRSWHHIHDLSHCIGNAIESQGSLLWLRREFSAAVKEREDMEKELHGVLDGMGVSFEHYNSHMGDVDRVLWLKIEETKKLAATDYPGADEEGVEYFYEEEEYEQMEVGMEEEEGEEMDEGE